jgi:hypothetical protein
MVVWKDRSYIYIESFLSSCFGLKSGEMFPARYSMYFHQYALRLRSDGRLARNIAGNTAPK